MGTLVFDIETDGLLRAADGKPAATQMFCMVTQDLETGRQWRWSSLPGSDGTIAEGIAQLEDAERLIAHNGVGFDLPAIEKFAGVTLDRTKLRDTLVLSHLMFPKIIRTDKKRSIPKEVWGRYSLEAWGWRLGHHKGDYAKTEHAFEELTPELVDYCANDVSLTADLYNFLAAREWPEESIELEHRFAWEIARMMDNGFPFDMEAAVELEQRVEREMAAVDERLHEALGKREVCWSGKTQPRDTGAWQRSGERWVRQEPLNLGSTVQVTDKIQELYDWKPRKFTPSGDPKFDESVIAALPDRVTVKDDLLERSRLEGARRRLLGNAKNKTGLIDSAVHEDEGWWIYHYCNHNGARTGRCTHAHPNVNFPRVTSPWGPEFRGMVKAPEGYVIVGCDMSGVDARMIAHYLAPHDGGKMMDLIMSGDLHDHNRQLMAEVVPDITRSTGKNVFYAVCYGAKAMRVALTAGVERGLGSKLRSVIRGRVPGLDHLISDVEYTAKERGWLKGLDGRRLIPDAAFSALNTLAQGGAAVVMKEATALVMEHVRGWLASGRLILHVHDEGQILCRPEDADEIGAAFVEAIKEAGRRWNVRCPLDGEYKVGRTWAETH